MKDTLTQTERRVYEYLIDFLAEHTYQPSIREIGRQFRIKSTKTVSDILQALARKGFIERDPSRSRGVRLVGYTGVGGTNAVPYFSAVRASDPPVDDTVRAGYLVLDRRLAHSERAFMLRVDSDAMRDRGVLTGDYVVVDPATIPEDGALVAARIGGAATVRAWSRRGANVVLSPAGGDESEMVVQPGDDVAVLGVVTSVIRNYAGGDPFAQQMVAQAATADVH